MDTKYVSIRRSHLDSFLVLLFAALLAACSPSAPLLSDAGGPLSPAAASPGADAAIPEPVEPRPTASPAGYASTLVPSAGAQAGLPADCSESRLGAILFTESTSGESTAPYLARLAQDGYVGLVGAPTYEQAADVFPDMEGWGRAQVCNSLSCLQTRAERADAEGLAYEYLAYGPERLAGVPEEEQSNLPWAVQSARAIADEWGKELIISFSTKQLHQEAEERGGSWEDPSGIINLLAPHGDIWLIQAADEFWRADDGSIRPVLSQRNYPPGEAFRAEVEKWVGWIRAANPEIEIWIQLAVQRIGVPGFSEPSVELLQAYRDSIADLVDGVYIMPVYGSVEQFPAANQVMEEVFRCACGGSCGEQAPSVPAPDPSSSIVLVEEGWTDDVSLPCPPGGDCMTLLPGYYYRIYENTRYPCGSEGNHQFIVLDSQQDSARKHLFVKFLGGAVGFWYEDNGTRLYYPNERAAGITTSSYNRNMFFRATVSEEAANGVTQKFRENPDFRILMPSYCSHDLYLGQGEFHEADGFARWGYLAAMEAVDFVQQSFSTDQIITYGGSAGASGAFYIGKDQDNVAGIIMDSFAGDLSAIRDGCDAGMNVFGGSYPCFCPEGGETCMEVLAPRIGFSLGSDEPYQIIQGGFDIPIYHIWNQYDASRYAYLHFENLHETIRSLNPGGQSVSQMVCIANPQGPPGPTCNLHVPSGYDTPETEALVNDVYRWALSLVEGPTQPQSFIPICIR